MRNALLFPMFASMFALPVAVFGCSSTPSAPLTGPDAATFPVHDGGIPEEAATLPVTCPAPTLGPTMHGSNIAADETWDADKSPHIIMYDTTVGAKVTLQPCAEVRIAPKVTVTVNLKGSIVGEGTASTPILITALDAAKPWVSLRAIGGSVRLAHATVEGGGDPLNTDKTYTGMLYGQPGSDPAAAKDAFALKNVVVKGSKSNGIHLQAARFSDDSGDVTVTGSAAFPVSIYPRVVGTLPSGVYTGNTNDEILLPGHGLAEDIISDTTMHERGVPYHVGDLNSSGQLRVGTSSGMPVATLTIEPGVTVRFIKKGVFQIEKFGGTMPASGALIAQGTEAKPITFTSAEASPAPGDWLGLTFGAQSDARNVLDHVTIAYAGLAGSGGSGSCSGSGVVKHALVISGGQPTKSFFTNSKIIHATNGIDRGWQGAQIDFAATNKFDDVSGCKMTNPQAAGTGCTNVAPCAL